MNTPHNILATLNTASLTELETVKVKGYEIDHCHTGLTSVYIVAKGDNEVGAYRSFQAANMAIAGFIKAGIQHSHEWR